MKILWVTNALLPEAVSKLRGQSEIKGTGGWLLALSEALLHTGDVVLSVVSISPLVNKCVKIDGSQISYYAIPYRGDSSYRAQYENAFRKIYYETAPDVVHIHGTEFPHSLAALRACGSEKTVVSLQGLASVISRYYMAGLTKQQIFRNPTLHDILRQSLSQQQREMRQRGHYETQLLRSATHIIGRTCWDHAHIWAINPSAQYFHCDEILRKEFYEGDVWNYERCIPHSVFLSQGSYPLKGLHKLLEALPLVRRIYPDVNVRVAGPDITYCGAGFRDRIKISSYGRIVNEIIHKNRLENSVKFLGPLNAGDMKQEYLKANVFVCPSSIENSPNSLGEAQVLGVPCVASYVGGIPDFMRGNEDNLYRFDDVEMLAKKICNLFEKRVTLEQISMRQVALKRHDIESITSRMMEIYKEVLRK